MSKAPPSLKWVIWSLAAVFYLYEFFLSVTPSIMIHDLMKAFSVDATAVGVLSAWYFYIYAPMQLPAGMLTDRFGARKLMAVASIISGVGALFFGVAQGFTLAALGRFFIGLGASFGFVGIVYVATHWFSLKRRGVMIGLANTLGALGAALGQGPLREAIDTFSWRGLTLILAIFGVALGLLIYFIMRDDPSQVEAPKPTTHDETSLWKNLLIVTKNPYTWVVAVSALFFYLTTSVFAGLWGASFVHGRYGVSMAEASLAVSMIFIGWAIGGPLIGMISDRLNTKKMPILVATALGCALTAVAIYVKVSQPLLYALFFLIGFASSAELLCFSYAIDINPFGAKATATAFVNFIVVIGTATFQPLVGYILDLNWIGQMDGAIRSYPPHAYNVAMAVFPASFVLAFALAFFLKRDKGLNL